MQDPVTLIFWGLVYILPAGLAYRRGHKNTGSIVALNLLLGWTVVGWVGALVWALTNNVNVQSAEQP